MLANFYKYLTVLQGNNVTHSVAENSFQTYSALHVHFYEYAIPKLLQYVLREKDKHGLFSVLDLGCGDGKLLFSLQFSGLLKNANRIVGVDISEVRVKKLVKNTSDVIGIVSDACSVEELDNASFDVIICSQLIEHVPDDHTLLKEIRRLLNRNGQLYISSVIKRPYGFWIYRRDGQFYLDPTHVREYSSKEAFILMLKKEGFDSRVVSQVSVKYSLVDLLVRTLIKLHLYRPEYARTLFLRHKYIAKCRRFLEIPVFGYRMIECLASLQKISEV